MQQINVCPRCGGKLEINGNNYQCDFCGGIFEKEKEVGLLEDIANILDDIKQEKVSNLRRQLWEATHTENLSMNNVLSIAHEIRNFLPDDFLACFYEAVHTKSTKEINEYLLNIDVEENYELMDIIIKFMIRIMEHDNIIVLNELIERTYKTKDLNTYNELTNELSNVAHKIDEGIYELNLQRDIFVAYSSKDIDIVLKTVEELEEQGFTCFVALRNLRHGKGAIEKYDVALKQAIDNCKMVLFISTKNSRSLSCDAVKKELPYIMQKDKEYAPAEYRNDYSLIPAKYKKPRIHYVIDTPVGNASDRFVSAFFGDTEWRYDIDQVIDVAFMIKTGNHIVAEEKDDTASRLQKEQDELKLLMAQMLKQNNTKAEENELKREIEALKNEINRSKNVQVSYERPVVKDDSDDIRKELEALRKELKKAKAEPKKKEVVSQEELLRRELEQLKKELKKAKTEQVKPSAQKKDKMNVPAQKKGTAPVNTKAVKKNAPVVNDKAPKNVKAPAPLTVDTKGNYTKYGNILYFGKYPQTRLIDNNVIESLNAIVGKLPTATNRYKWKDFGYIIKDKTESYMFYIDIDFDGDGEFDYRGVYFLSYRPYNTYLGANEANSYQDDNRFKTGSIYWFKYEPIKWTILDEANFKTLILSDILLDSQNYDIENNNYQESTIRKWLNSKFYATAFNDIQKQMIIPSKVDNSVSSTGSDTNPYVCQNTQEKVFLMSYKEMGNYFKNNGLKVTHGSSYAKCQGLYVADGNSRYWLRSPDFRNPKYVRMVDADGASYGGNAKSTFGGVRPACWIVFK